MKRYLRLAIDWLTVLSIVALVAVIFHLVLAPCPWWAIAALTVVTIAIGTLLLWAVDPWLERRYLRKLEGSEHDERWRRPGGRR